MLAVSLHVEIEGGNLLNIPNNIVVVPWVCQFLEVSAQDWNYYLDHGWLRNRTRISLENGMVIAKGRTDFLNSVRMLDGVKTITLIYFKSFLSILFFWIGRLKLIYGMIVFDSRSDHNMDRIHVLVVRGLFNFPYGYG